MLGARVGLSLTLWLQVRPAGADLCACALWRLWPLGGRLWGVWALWRVGKRDADREVWRYLALSCRGGIRRGADGLRPLDSAIPLALLDPTVRMFLHPLPGSGSAPKSGQTQENAPGSGQKRRADNLAAENKRLRAELAAASQGGGGKGGGKQKGKKQKGRGTSADQFRPKMPAGLIGKSYRTSDGNPICFSFNLPCGCSGAQPGGTCSKGAHVCAEPGCSANHSLQQHA